MYPDRLCMISHMLQVCSIIFLCTTDQAMHGLPLCSKSANVLEVLDSIALDALDGTGFYYSGKAEVNSDIKSESTCNTSK